MGLGGEGRGGLWVGRGRGRKKWTVGEEEEEEVGCSGGGGVTC
jgi:hypothetical protein